MLVYIKRLLAAGLDELPIKNNARGKLLLANRFRSQASFVAQEEQDQQNVIAGGHETITVDLRPNAYSVCGSICTLVFLCLLGGTSFSRFLVQEPTITSELVQASLSNTSHWLPDLAMTISTAFSEEDMLDFVWPEFRWYEIRDGFTGGIQFSRTLMPESEVRFGQDGCSLAVGYERQSSGTETTYTSDAGRKWPVFCVLNSTKKLQGRFGDPKWDYLNVRLYPCNSTSSKFTNSALSKRWSGRCRSRSEILGFVRGMGVNVWSRFGQENFKTKSNLLSMPTVHELARLDPPFGCKCKPGNPDCLKRSDREAGSSSQEQAPSSMYECSRGQDGMLPGGYVAGGWSYFFFQNLAAQSKLKATVDFQLNEADVNRPWDLVFEGEKSYSWFNYDAFEAARNPLEDQQEEFLSIDLRVSPMKRAISVKYNTIDEFFGDIGGSWEFAIIMGFILCSCLSSLRCLSMVREVRRWFLQEPKFNSVYPSYKARSSFSIDERCQHCRKSKALHCGEALYCDDLENANGKFLQWWDDEMAAQMTKTSGGGVQAETSPPLPPAQPQQDHRGWQDQLHALQLELAGIRAVLPQNQNIGLHDAGQILVGLSWNLWPGRPATDLDCSALLFDSNAVLVDACYYNQREIFSGSLKHSGDARDGANHGFDEVITLDLNRLPQAIQVVVFIVNANRGGTLADVQTAHVTFQQEGVVKASLGVSSGNIPTCGSIVALLKRHNDVGWNLRPIGKPCPGRTFAESYSHILSSLPAVVDPAIVEERRASMHKTFNMQKDDIVELKEDLFISGEDLFVGLGWDTHCDLDASIIVADGDSDGACMVDVINFGNKTFGKAIIHNGDNRTGKGNGDDERIQIDLDCIPAEVKAMWVIVNIYTERMTFSQVKGAYIRLCAARNEHVLCQFKLTDNAASNSTGLVLAKIYRNAAQRWCIMAVGKGCGGRTARDSATQKACGVTGPLMSFSIIQALRSKANQRQPQLSGPQVEAQRAKGNPSLGVSMEPQVASLGYPIMRAI